MDEAAKAFLFELLNTPSPSGFEAAGQGLWAARLRLFADGVESDTYGTAWATRLGSAGEGSPALMLEAHADEIGFMVQHISDEGFLHLSRIGGSDRAVARDKRVQILGSKGPVPGVIGNVAIHIRDSKNDKLPELHELFVDVGAGSRAEAEALGVRIGQPLVYAESARELFAGRLTGRALDNRVGGFILSEVMARLASRPRLEATVHAVNAVQEEVGGHGARMIAYRLRPAAAVVLDVTHATDSPGIDKTKHGAVKLGGGPTLTHGKANHPAVVARLEEVARQLEIPVQHEASSPFTGTDTDDIFNTREGVPSALVSLPMRYMHSTIETVSLDDVERCIALLTGFAAALRAGDRFRVEI